VRWLAIIAIAACGVRPAVAESRLPRVITAPTAWLPPAGAVVGTASLDHRGDGAIDASFGLGGLASVELGADSDLRTCSAPPCAGDRRGEPRWHARAAFRMGVGQDAWFRGQPALALGLRTTIGYQPARAAELHAVASRTLGPMRVHAGAALHDARVGERRLTAALRPLVGWELIPPQYPKTTLLADWTWLARFAPGEPGLEWTAGWGVRYQAFRWGTIELDVRHREDEGLAASTVLVRVSGILDPRARGAARAPGFW
jgi:hypothetical protein